jgi:glycosyltransferase involved in cell wall biosynthesis
MKQNPNVSVIMPVYNSEQYLRQAIESILNQTYSNFELIIISEYGTNDESLVIIESYLDKRIRHIHNTVKLGLVKSLNAGLEEAQGEYIARMDADDISLNTRLECQVQFMDNNPEIGVLGTWTEIVDANGRVIEHLEHPTRDVLIKWALFFNCYIAHPTVMFRRAIYERVGGYDPEAFNEDYELWLRAAKITKLANLPNRLVTYRVQSQSITQTQSQKVFEYSYKLSRDAMSKALNRDIPLKFIIMYRTNKPAVDIKEAYNASTVLLDLYDNYVNNNHIYLADRIIIKQDVENRIYEICKPFALKSPLSLIRVIIDLATRSYTKVSVFTFIKFFVLDIKKGDVKLMTMVNIIKKSVLGEKHASI